MAQRKETPDLLAEMLGAESTADVMVEAETSPQPPAKKPAVRRPRKAKPKGWEYIIVSFQDYKGWRPRYENGKEYQGWMELPLIHEYTNILSSEGWELVTASAGERMYGSADRHQLYFRRVKTG